MTDGTSDTDGWRQTLGAPAVEIESSDRARRKQHGVFVYSLTCQDCGHMNTRYLSDGAAIGSAVTTTTTTTATMRRCGGCAMPRRLCSTHSVVALPAADPSGQLTTVSRRGRGLIVDGDETTSVVVTRRAWGEAVTDG